MIKIIGVPDTLERSKMFKPNLPENIFSAENKSTRGEENEMVL